MMKSRKAKACLGRNSSESRPSSAPPAKTLQLNLDNNAATLKNQRNTGHIIREIQVTDLEKHMSQNQRNTGHRIREIHVKESEKYR